MSKKMLSECPNCSSIWGIGSEEWEWQQCDCCGWPSPDADNFEEEDEDEDERYQKPIIKSEYKYFNKTEPNGDRFINE
jgi:hypothetical protein